MTAASAINQYPYTAPVLNRFYVLLDDLTITTRTAIDLDDTNNPDTCTGEQTVTSSLIIGGDIAFSTNRPTPPSANSCTSSLGEARGYNLNLFNGSGALANTSRSGTFLQGGLPASPTLFTTTVGTTVVTGTIGVKTDTCNSAQCPSKPEININPKRHIVYWHLSGDNK